MPSVRQSWGYSCGRFSGREFFFPVLAGVIILMVFGLVYVLSVVGLIECWVCGVGDWVWEVPGWGEVCVCVLSLIHI